MMSLLCKIARDKISFKFFINGKQILISYKIIDFIWNVLAIIEWTGQFEWSIL